MLRRPAAVLLAVLLAASPGLAQARRGRIHGRISDTSKLPLPGVTVMLAHEASAPLVTHTDEVGHYTFDVPAGRYTLTAELTGFETAVRPNLVVSADPLVVDLVLELGGIQMETQVVAQVPRVMTVTEPNAPATVDKEVIKMAPVQGIRYDSALPLLPGVVRGPDGLISVAGARAWQGTVLADNLRETDPLSGEPSLSLPITAIDTVHVFSPAPPAEAGPGTGGITNVNTKAGTDAFTFGILGVVPRPRFTGDRGTSGVESWSPQFGLVGPIVKGRAWFTQSLEYRWERFQFETVAGKQDSSVSGWTSFTRIDVKPRGSHHVTLRLTVDPDTTRHFGLDAFAPASSVPDLKRGSVSVGFVDRAALGPRGTIETRLHIKRHALGLTPDGSFPYSVGHDQVRGSYFSTVDRVAYRIEASTTWSRAFASRYGEHLVKAGTRIAYAALDGTVASRPVDYLRSDGTTARRIEFAGAGALSASATEVGFFVQDAWKIRPGLHVDVGVRGDATSHLSGPAIWPRLTWTYELRPARTTVSGGVGVFVDKPILAPGVFAARQARRELVYDDNGQPIGPWRLFSNRADGTLALPRSVIWSVQFDQAVSAGLMVRARFQERRGRREFVVRPVVESSTAGALVLSGDGRSHARAFEATAGYRSPHGTHQFYVSYVRSVSSGNLNDLNTVAGNFETALVLPDENRPLRAEVPHRFLAWGILSLPWRMSVSPFVEVRSGFPFTRIDENWNPVGSRNDSRFPVFVSLDVAVEKAVTLPFGLPARLGVKLFNIAGRHNGRAIQADVARPDFGRTYDPLRRQLRGTLEIAWNKG